MATNNFAKLLIQAFQQLSDEQKEEETQQESHKEEQEPQQEDKITPQKQSNSQKNSSEETQTHSISNTDESHTGILKSYNPHRKYGFIIYDNNKSIFVHESAFVNIDPTSIPNIIKHSVTFRIHNYIDKTQKQKQKATYVYFNKDNNITNNNQKQLNDTAKYNNKSQIKTFINQNENNKNDNQSDSDSDSDSDNQSEQNNESDSEQSNESSEETETAINHTETLENFVISLLKFAPKQKLLVSELGLKITDTFDKSIKQLTGLKSREFFNGMKDKNIIKIKTKKMENGELAFAQLINKSIKKQKHKNKILTKSTKKIIDNDVSSNDRKLVGNPWNGITSAEAVETIRSAILRHFIDGTRKRVMLSAVNSYCKKYVGVPWKDIMVQTPRQFVNEMVYDKLVILDKEFRKNTPYPFVKLNENSEKVMKLNVKNLSEIIDKKGKGMVNKNVNVNSGFNEGKKRKLDSDNVDIKSEEPKKKKQKINVNNNKDNKIILPGIKMNENGAEMVQKIIEKFKQLQDKHDIHFHFDQ